MATRNIAAQSRDEILAALKEAGLSTIEVFEPSNPHRPRRHKMKVSIHQAVLTVQGKEKTLSKAVAKQFPIREASIRQRWTGDYDSPTKPALCKVTGKNLGTSHAWLFLVEDEEAGLAWEPAFQVRPLMQPTVRKKGGRWDNVSAVPTVIL